MADITPSAQVLKEFVQNLLDDLAGGRLTPDGAIIASQQYPYLRAIIDEHKDEIALALQNEGTFRIVLEETLRASAAVINRELPQFQVEKSDQQLSPNDVVARAQSFRTARSEVSMAVRAQRMKVERLRKTFINRLVLQWIDQTRSLMDNEKQQQVAGVLKTELEEKLVDISSFEELSTCVQRALKNTRVADRVAAAIQRGAAPTQRELVTASQKLAGVAAIPKELVSRLATPRPDRLAAIAIQTISSTTLSPGAAFAHAVSLANIAEALSSPLVKEKDVAAAGVFFRVFASIPTQKVFAAAADALFNQLSPFARQEVIKATFSRALEGVLAKTDVLTKRLGQDFVESEFFRLVIDSARKEFARGAGGGAGTKQARGALEDVIGSLLRGPIMEPLVGNPKEMILSYFELLAVETKLPRDNKILFPDHAPAAPGLSSSTALRAAASGLIQRLPSWQVFYIMLLASSPSITHVYPGNRLSSLSSMGGAPIGAIGGGLNALLGWATRGASNVAFGLGGGLVGMLFGGGLGALFNRLRGPREPDRFFDDTPKLIAVGAVIVIVLLFVFPSFINSPLTSRAAKYAALFVASQFVGTEADFANETTQPPDLTSVAAECLNNSFPKPSVNGVRTSTINGRAYAFPIAPYDRTYHTCGHHDGLLATDIGIRGVNTDDPHAGLAVVAYTAGVISTTRLDDPKGGKYIVLRGDDGRSYYYAHNCALYVNPGDRVSAGQVIAASGDTGSAATTPEHLHFAISGAGESFFQGGSACPASDFEQKFGLGKCASQQLCPNK